MGFGSFLVGTLGHVNARNSTQIFLMKDAVTDTG